MFSDGDFPIWNGDADVNYTIRYTVIQVMYAVRNLGNGRDISFWDDCWVGDQRLRDRFTRLYNAALNKDARISESGFWVEGVWCFSS